MTAADATNKALIVLASAVMAHADIACAMGEDGKQSADADDAETKAKTLEVRELTGRHYRRLVADMSDPAWFPDPPKLDGGSILPSAGGLDLPSLLTAALKTAIPIIEGFAAKK